MAASIPQRVQHVILRISQWFAWLPPALARLTVGLVFLQSGWGKLHDLDSIINYFRELGIPAPELQAPFVSGIELVGGVLLLAGLGTRLAALPLMGTMVVAIATARWKELEGLGDLFGFIEWLYLALLVYLAVGGPGSLSVDQVLSKRFTKPLPDRS